MPQLVAVALVGGLVWYAWRAFKRELARVSAQVPKKPKAAKNVQKGVDVTVLEEGPDGVYRQKDS